MNATSRAAFDQIAVAASADRISDEEMVARFRRRPKPRRTAKEARQARVNAVTNSGAIERCAFEDGTISIKWTDKPGRPVSTTYTWNNAVGIWASLWKMYYADRVDGHGLGHTVVRWMQSYAQDVRVAARINERQDVDLTGVLERSIEMARRAKAKGR